MNADGTDQTSLGVGGLIRLVARRLQDRVRPLREASTTRTSDVMNADGSEPDAPRGVTTPPGVRAPLGRRMGRIACVGKGSIYGRYDVNEETSFPSHPRSW